ncbi:MAG: hypothetical protein ACYSWP_11210, partial [Planctomycetota bacterium]
QGENYLPSLHWLDYVVVIGYLLFIGLLGSSFAKRQKTTDHYYTGGRAIPTWAMKDTARAVGSASCRVLWFRLY